MHFIGIKFYETAFKSSYELSVRKVFIKFFRFEGLDNNILSSGLTKNNSQKR